tara:strand:- start:1 stop:228 length:228 start_codon:yes stop_codon:yes gene_type:complete
LLPEIFPEPELFTLLEETVVGVEDLTPDLPLLDITVIYLVVLAHVAAEEEVAEDVPVADVPVAAEELGTLIEAVI